MRSQFMRNGDVRRFFGLAAIFAITLLGLTASTSAIVEVIVAGLILAGLAKLKYDQDKAAARVPVRVKVDPPSRRR